MKIMKKIVNCTVCALSVFALSFALTACGGKDDLHGEDGHLHVSENYLIDDEEHWKVCEICDAPFSVHAHVMKNGVCEVCGYYDDYTEGLEFSEIKGEYGELIGFGVAGKGTATDIADLRIPYCHNGMPVTAIDESAFKDCTEIKTLTIANSVNEIGFYAFQGCTSLTRVVTGNGLKSLGFSIFYGCENLTDVQIGSGVTSIGEWAFRDCTSLTELYLPDGLTDLNGGAFDGCTNLKYNEYDGGLYYGSKDNPFIVLMALKDKTAPNIEIPAGTKFLNGDVFSNCPNLTSIVIPEGVMSIARSTFANCANLAEVTFPSTLTSIGNTAFSGCKSLTQIVLGKNMKSIGQNAFQGCTSLTSVTFGNPDGWYYKTMLNVTETTDVEDDLSNPSVAAECIVTKYSKYFLLHD